MITLRFGKLYPWRRLVCIHLSKSVYFILQTLAYAAIVPHDAYCRYCCVLYASFLQLNSQMEIKSCGSIPTVISRSYSLVPGWWFILTSKLCTNVCAQHANSVVSHRCKYPACRPENSIEVSIYSVDSAFLPSGLSASLHIEDIKSERHSACGLIC